MDSEYPAPPSPDGRHDHFIDLGGPLRVVDHGGAGPNLVLVHGLGGSSENWLAIAPLLRVHYRVLALDLPGFGHTPPQGRKSRVTHFADLVARFVATLPGGTATLVGNSMGGLVSLLAARRHPDRVDGLVLIDPAMPAYDRRAIDRQVAAVFTLYAMPGVGEVWMRYLSGRSTPEKALVWFMRLCGVEREMVDPAVYDAHLAMARTRARFAWAQPSFLEAARSLLSVILRPGFYEETAKGVRAPVLLVHGGRDRLLSVKSARILASKMTGWTYAELPELGHTPMLEAPQRVLDVMLAWQPPTSAKVDERV